MINTYFGSYFSNFQNFLRLIIKYNCKYFKSTKFAFGAIVHFDKKKRKKQFILK